MTEFKIEKGVPLPPRLGNNPAKYPWAEMEVGDSFFVAGKTSAAFSGSVQGARARHGRDFAMRAVEGGIREWRIK